MAQATYRNYAEKYADAANDVWNSDYASLCFEYYSIELKKDKDTELFVKVMGSAHTQNNLFLMCTQDPNGCREINYFHRVSTYTPPMGQGIAAPMDFLGDTQLGMPSTAVCISHNLIKNHEVRVVEISKIKDLLLVGDEMLDYPNDLTDRD